MSNGIITQPGTHLGIPDYVLVMEGATFPLLLIEAIRLNRDGVPYVHPSLLTDDERDRARKCLTRQSS